MDFEKIASDIIDCAVKIHIALGPGLLESVYQTCLAYDLRQLGYKVETEIKQPVQYKEITFDQGYRIDMLVENSIIIENKTVDHILPVHEAQLITYLKLRGCSLGFLINWKVSLLKNGIKRKVNNHPSERKNEPQSR
jgi:GxxExxY protein